MLTSTASAVTEVGQLYSQTNAASGGLGPYTYSLSSGTLPAGLTLNSTSGTVSGTPTTAGSFGYTIMAISVIIFRRKWPLDSIARGYIHPLHPLPAILLLALCAITYVAVFLGYGTQLLAMMVFYIVASVWFAVHRYKYCRRGEQFTMPWPKPRGY